MAKKEKNVFGKELYLASNAFNEPLELNNFEALAQTIQNIIIVEKGTYPNTPRLGVGISNYLFEIMDDQTLSEISTAINNQISTYIVSEDVNISINLTPMEDWNEQNINSLKIDIKLTDSDSNEEIELNYFMAGNKNNKKIISKLVYS